MAKLYDLARMTTATVGTGTITLGSAVSGCLTFALAGVQDGDVVSYGIADGANSEVGTGTYTASGTSLTRTVTKSTNANAAISLSGSAQVYITERAEDIIPTSRQLLAGGLVTGGGDLTADRTLTVTAAAKSDQQAGTSTTTVVTPAHQQDHDSGCKAWAKVNGSTGALSAGYNIASTSRTAGGQYTITLTTSFASANYACVASAEFGSGGAGAVALITNGSLAAGSVGINTYSLGGTNSDCATLHVAFFGRQ